MGCFWQVYKGLSVLFFTLFLIFLLVILFVAAGTGIVDVPGLSGLFGQGAASTPAPTTASVQDSETASSSRSEDGVAGTPVPDATATPAEVSEETAAIQRAEDALSQANEPGRFTVEVTDSDLTALLGEVISSLDSPPVSNLVVTFEQDAFLASGTITSPFRADIRTKGHFVLGDDTVEIEFTEAQLGALAMPKIFRDQLTLQANEFLAANVGAGQGLLIESVDILPGKIVVSGERLEE